jgi:hypothetical protein
MRSYRNLLSAVLILLAGVLLFVPATEAQKPLWSHKAILTFERPFEIPGKILPPGTYVFKLIVPSAHVGQVLNVEETEVFGIFFTYTLDRAPGVPLPPDVLLEPREKGGKKWDRMVGWFSPGETVGDRISFDQFKPVEP